MCAAAIGRARAAGTPVSVAFLTTGVIDRKLMCPGHRASTAPRSIGGSTNPARSPGLLGVEIAGQAAVPTRELRNNLMATRVRLERMIEEFEVGEIWVPAFEGGHQDHDAANCLAATLRDRVEVTEFAAYHFADGKPHSQEFIEPMGTEEVLLLSATEQSVKKQALALYASEQGNLDYVALKTEARRPLPNYDYARPPHEGTLWYARNQWVPFRHPRVDFTSPGRVYADLAAFLREVSR